MSIASSSSARLRVRADRTPQSLVNLTVSECVPHFPVSLVEEKWCEALLGAHTRDNIVHVEKPFDPY